MLAGPKQGRAVAEIAGAGEDHPGKYGKRGNAEPAEISSVLLGSKSFGFGFRATSSVSAASRSRKGIAAIFRWRSAKVTRRC